MTRAVSVWLGHASVTMTAKHLSVDVHYLHKLKELKLTLIEQ